MKPDKKKPAAKKPSPPAKKSAPKPPATKPRPKKAPPKPATKAPPKPPAKKMPVPPKVAPKTPPPAPKPPATPKRANNGLPTTHCHPKRRYLPVNNGSRAPKPGTLTGRVWALADTVTAKLGRPAKRCDVMEEAERAGLNPSTVSTQFGRWRQFHGLRGRKEIVTMPKDLNKPAYVTTPEGLTGGQQTVMRFPETSLTPPAPPKPATKAPPKPPAKKSAPKPPAPPRIH